GGDPYKYLLEVYPEASGDALKLDPKNPRHQKKIVEAFYKRSTTFDSDRILRMVEALEASGKLAEEAEYGYSWLTEASKLEAERLEKQAKEEQERRKKEVDEYVKALKREIDRLDVVAGIQVSEKDRKDFVEYLLKMDKEGKTAYERDLASNFSGAIKTAYMFFKKMYEKEPSKAVKSKVAKEIFDSLSNFDKSRRPSSSSGADDLFESLKYM
ncbi:MAG: hypothetical protein RMM53_07545, partial [Bacteroidia bacterium]|nr:hypothetical protein [Bacteroidia bacterium]